MSGEEKAIQVGIAVSEYQAAKVELAHVDKRVATIADAYSVAGDALKQNHFHDSPAIEGNRLKFTYARMPNCAQILLNEAGLLELIQERNAARQRLKRASDDMKSLGVDLQ